jgi:hypothetical protein
MATEKIRVGIIGASMRNGWGRDAHIPALSALPEFEITAVSTSRQETADETAKHFEIPHAFTDPYKMVKAARSHRSTSKAAPPTGQGSCSRSTAPRAPWLSCRQTLARRLTYRSPSSRCAVHGRANRRRISRYRRAIAGFHLRSRRGCLSTCFRRLPAARADRDIIRTAKPTPA